MKRIIFVSLYESTLAGFTVSRLSELLPLFESEYEIELVAGDYNHYKKQKLIVSEDFEARFPKVSVHLLPQPAYSKNISLKRIYSSKIFAMHLEKYLSCQEFDLVYYCMQDLLIGDAIRKVCKRKQKPYIVDIQDSWPAAFRMKLSNPIVETFVYQPLEKIADRVYDQAAYVIAISDTYRQRGVLNKKNKTASLTVYNGIDLDQYKTVLEKEFRQDKGNEFWVIYNGTMGNSYNVPLIIKAIAELNHKGYEDIRFIALGNGPYYSEWKLLADKLGCISTFHTYDEVSYECMIGYLGASDVAVNPILDAAPQSISNKIRDYACAALPVINTQQNPEYEEIVEQLGIGINCRNELQDVINAILKLKQQPKVKASMKQYNINLFQKKFNAKITYQQIPNKVRAVLNERDK